MHQPHTQGGQSPPETSRPAPPGPVRAAVALMYTGAALMAIYLVTALLSINAQRALIRKVGSTLTARQVHEILTFYVVSTVIFCLLAAGLWILMAWANRTGQRWGRTVASVLFGLNTLLLLLNVVRPTLTIALLFWILTWLVGLVALVLLWRKESSEYFAAPGLPR